MTEVFRDPSAGWVALLIVLLPLAIIAIGEFEERLRQRDSPLDKSVSILRGWVVPLFAAWAVAEALFIDDNGPGALVQIIATALVLASSVAALSALGVMVTWIGDRPRAEGQRSVPRLLLALPRLLALLFTAWLLLAGVWSVDLSAALTALGVTSLIVSFALQDTLSGVASGFLLLADQPFQPGDWISTGDLEGRVVDLNWRSSRIETRDGDLVVVPNSQLANATVTNFDEPTRAHRVVVPLQVAYSNAPTSAKDMLLAAARSTPGVLSEPPPDAKVVQIDDPLMGYEVHMWVDDYSIVPQVRSDFGSLVWYHSHRLDVPLPSPAQDLYLWDGPRTAESGRPTHADVLRGLQQSPLVAELGQDELDVLADGAVLDRFAAGETIQTGDGDRLEVIVRGHARIVLRPHETNDDDLIVQDLDRGDVFGVLGGVGSDHHDLCVVAVTDCVIVIAAPVAATLVISRSPALATALDQVASSRRRRVARALRRLSGLGMLGGPPQHALATVTIADEVVDASSALDRSVDADTDDDAGTKGDRR